MQGQTVPLTQNGHVPMMSGLREVPCFPPPNPIENAKFASLPSGKSLIAFKLF